ncbi:MAG TPA: RsmE family RNA methyltransferase [Chitinophagaceae bacterium]|nr:RsmE family RNA methyltransferase [Chitinophagaceae bacterium]HNF71560.1 RsmE family RNA methyltransferase [Chitinophagaceae bacterium]
MSLPYFFETEGYALSEESMHHALHVLRMKAGDECMICNGQGLSHRMRILEATKKNCSLSLIESYQAPVPSNRLHIAVSFTRNPARIEWFLEKACEMGVQKITPLLTKRCEKVHFKRERYQKILVSAMLQSQQVFLPELSEPAELASLLKQSDELKLLAHCLREQPRTAFATKVQGQKNILILIGPEGDFTPDEIDLCLREGACAVDLGSRRLRTETAALYTCAVFNALNPEV